MFTNKIIIISKIIFHYTNYKFDLLRERNILLKFGEVTGPNFVMTKKNRPNRSNIKYNEILF